MRRKRRRRGKWRRGRKGMWDEEERREDDL